MKTITQLKKHLKLSELAEINDCLKHYGVIVKDYSTINNYRYTYIVYKGKYFGIKMKDGEVLTLSISDNFVENWENKLL